MMIALIGSGGKTSTMEYLANLYASRDLHVIQTTSTHIKRPPIFFEVETAKELKNFDWQTNPITVGKGDGEKCSGLALEEIEKLVDMADVVLVEADGAKMLPLKVPLIHEPVIPQNADTIIVCTGLDAIGELAKESCFRFERAKELYNWEENHIIIPKDVAMILTDERAGLKDVGDREVVFLLNKADDEERISLAKEVEVEIIKNLKKKQIKYQIEITSYQAGMFPHFTRL